MLPGGWEEGGVGSAPGLMLMACLIGNSSMVAEISGADTQRLWDLMKAGCVCFCKGVVEQLRLLYGVRRISKSKQLNK